MNLTPTLPLSTASISNQEALSLPNISSDFGNNQQGVYDQLNELFNDQDQQERAIQEARDILGDSAKNLDDSEVYDLVNEVQHLVDTWIEEFERETFDGKTLNELLDLKQ
jgi:hypothetical protein